MTGARSGKTGGRPRPAVLRRCAADRAGVTALEFAFAAPVLFILLMGIFDIGHMAYLRAALHGAVQKVARDATLETADTEVQDAYVRAIVRGIAPDAGVTFSRSSYYDFTDISRPEAWNDKNSNGSCDNGETYTDENANGQWDPDVGKSGNGGANDVVVYTVNVSYRSPFPIPGMASGNSNRRLSATAVKKNQPFALQQARGSAVGTCK